MKLALFGVTGWANPVLDLARERGDTIVAIYTRREESACPHFPCANLAEEARRRGIPVIEDALPGEAGADWPTFAASGIDVLASVGYHRKIGPGVAGAATHAVNVHPSLLPRYRGPNPVNWALLAGERTTGVTLHRLTQTVDAGEILAQREVEIAPDDTSGTLRARLAEAARDVLADYLGALDAGHPPPPRPQDEQRATRTRRLTEADSRIDLDGPPDELVRRWRALAPWPGTWTQIGAARYAVVDVRRSNGTVSVTVERT